MPVSRDQALEAVAKLSTTADWDKVDPGVLQEEIIRDPVRAGREFTRFLQNGGRVEIVTREGVIPPKGGKVHAVTVPVNESRPWNAAVSAAGLNTDRGSDIWKVGNQYPPQVSAETEDEKIILVNFGKPMSSEGALSWGKKQGLRPKSPRACLAVGEHHPNLHRDLGLNEMAVVSLAPRSFEGKQQVVCCWWRGSGREAYLVWFADDWRANYWFAFSRYFLHPRSRERGFL